MRAIQLYLLKLGCAWWSFVYGLKGMKIPFYDVLAVSYHETGAWTSDVWRRANNGFGMRPVQTAPKFWNFTSGGYAGYFCSISSAHEYYEWLYRRGYRSNSFNNLHVIGGSLVNFMKDHNYFEADLYAYREAVESALIVTYKFRNPLKVLIGVLTVGTTVTLVIMNWTKIKNKFRKWTNKQ